MSDRQKDQRGKKPTDRVPQEAEEVDEVVEAIDTGAELQELESLDQLDAQAATPTERGDLAEFAVWKSCHLNETIPGLYLDRSLRILEANTAFCNM